ncbi:hypothetical protein BFJ66_g17078 [Fusarium oxysporum f. sp. cepae]|uniref:Uncharacterized protein n=1 Tax=Fusarium oxysporum f. sp. cepae TaxID=396571 RepID=A0A3L6N0U2_FUSOX|nr:hypothetical protein BFJ65_g14437 [Fusarium oxysporum f. sp. cepae]RKK21216.1 hypothetical protein BFJ67_g17401 [Fusarium oxysporum f. sp. cepae]RKK26533.1 hypothetical protein BFJ66_g17078 [Fusarium oxysporum f. sp. cepae]
MANLRAPWTQVSNWQRHDMDEEILINTYPCPAWIKAVTKAHSLVLP